MSSQSVQSQGTFKNWALPLILAVGAFLFLGFLGVVFAALLVAAKSNRIDPNSLQSPSDTAGMSYTNYRVEDVPWSIHVIRIDRTNAPYRLFSVHADEGALGISPVSAQARALSRHALKPVAAINGDFYQRDRTYAGDPRGLQIVNGEVISGPNGGAAFWVDGADEPHATNVTSLFQVTWPDGTKTPFVLNGERRSNGLELYTPSLGSSTHTSGGREYVLEAAPGGPWLPLRMGQTYLARIREIRDGGDAPLSPDVLVLSAGQSRGGSLPRVATGAVLKIVTASSPDLADAKAAIGGGPVLVRLGRRQKVAPPSEEGYEFSSMSERHPRSAIGWNQNQFFLVEVDGRQRDLSVGMTLEELSDFLIKLGCLQAMNLDGGGSATLWYRGRVKNSPCDGHERPIANSLFVIEAQSGADSTPSGARAESQ